MPAVVKKLLQVSYNGKHQYPAEHFPLSSSSLLRCMSDGCPQKQLCSRPRCLPGLNEPLGSGSSHRLAVCGTGHPSGRTGRRRVFFSHTHRPTEKPFITAFQHGQSCPELVLPIFLFCHGVFGDFSTMQWRMSLCCCTFDCVCMCNTAAGTFYTLKKVQFMQFL